MTGSGARLIASRPCSLLLCLLLPVAGCARGPDAGGASGDAHATPPEFPVEVEPTRARSVEYSLSAVGSVEAFERVQVVARVPGAVEQVRFAEGARVAQDQVLVEIEPQRYRIEVESARAALRKAEAELADARAGLERREREPGLFPVEDV